MSDFKDTQYIQLRYCPYSKVRVQLSQVLLINVSQWLWSTWLYDLFN